ncbi:hypothetical protein ASD11_04745 [Aeromicrobium sp. Root495]|uniref:copper transporter n=1 Tax=Aeromicrobium sp. Root495 TaxID=1736550 RepID=UPI0006FE5B85|nr:copper transporter [Aeromicrobium sp. Root495]KQY58934.1 hypothetical protein ASD11_04745 [Aeromicrobium sp. Root495]
MISFRYHLVSIAAVLIALAAGVALGAGLLDDAGSELSGSDDSTDPALARFDEGYAARTAPALLGDKLAKHSVVVLTLPGADEGQVADVVADVKKAGGSVTGQGVLTAKLLDPANRQFAESVAQQAASDAGVTLSGESYAQVGEALGRSVAGKVDASLDDKAAAVDAAMVEAKLVTWKNKPSKAADLAVVVSGSSRAGGSGPVLAALAQGLDGAGAGTVVAGPTASSREEGYVAEVRDADSPVSTVDVTDAAAGPVVVALALAREASGNNGAWGTSRSADGALPR